MSQEPRMVLGNVNYQADSQARVVKKLELNQKVKALEEFFNQCHDEGGKFCSDGASIGPMVEMKPKKPGGEIDGVTVRGSKWTATSKNGTKVSVYDVDENTVSKDEKEKMLSTLAEIRDLYPDKLHVNKILLKNDATFTAEGNEGAAGQSFVFSRQSDLKKNTALSLNVDEPSRFGPYSEDNYKPMPSQEKVGFDAFTVLHETGHHFDAAHNRSDSGPNSTWRSTATLSLYFNQSLRPSMSGYGAEDYRENYAEAFAEWHASKGKTKNATAIAYAKHQGWAGSKTAVKPPAKMTDVVQVSIEEDGTTQFAWVDGVISFIEYAGPNAKGKIINASEGDEPTEEDINYANAIVAETIKELNKKGGTWT